MNDFLSIRVTTSYRKHQRQLRSLYTRGCLTIAAILVLPELAIQDAPVLEQPASIAINVVQWAATNLLGW
ncbi:hypothetical protein [Pleionea sp. CnH1-48]|uniref:hypothetical protein n=1 Tax=Pleionea sp. CnH1-48 TaxID=2954494 RepID=UPI00209734B7|nr:hypothetical protein [Pleionea sp. CnH1-48]MCO7226672.1 hypothetical protein [Pleionea sp. CnH1-48]